LYVRSWPCYLKVRASRIPSPLDGDSTFAVSAFPTFDPGGVSSFCTMSKIERLNQWLTLVANLGVVAGLIFLTLEVRTNTEANLIAVDQTVSENWMELNGQLAQDRELAELITKAQSGDELDPVEALRFEGWVRQHLTHASQILRLYDGGLLDAGRVRQNFRDVRKLAEGERFRSVVEQLGPETRFREMILAEDGLDRWLAP